MTEEVVRLTKPAGKQSHRSQKSHCYHGAGVKLLPSKLSAGESEHSDGSIRMIHDFCPDQVVPLLTQHLHRKRPHGSGLLGPGFDQLTSTSSPQPELRDSERPWSRHLSATETASWAMRPFRMPSVSLQRLAFILLLALARTSLALPNAALQPYRHQRISRVVDPPSSCLGQDWSMAQGRCAHLSLHWRHLEQAPQRPGTRTHYGLRPQNGRNCSPSTCATGRTAVVTR